MAIKINIVLDDDVKSELDRLVASGMRSRIINDALKKELLQIKRQRLARAQDDLRGKSRTVSTREIVKVLRKDRSRP
jgi:metal-responsive CopG/Arc/MetJ family transcriptional regulator